MKALIGKKIGMTQVFKDDGSMIPVTLLEVTENYVSKILKNGDQVTHVEIGKDRQKKPRKVDLGNYKKLGFVPKFKVAVKVHDSEGVEEGAQLKASVFNVGDVVKVTGKSKGKGFTGVMKRWNFKGGKRTHGQSDRERAPGSIGSGTTPGRVLKGKKMAGRSGFEQVTLSGVVIESVVDDSGIIAVRGPVPGFNGSYVLIHSKE
ncbi:MAG: 50S ribosomal protein L3 [Candidatus Dojkabacteria bacterium]|nr:MAG: 50S ribosomal protein L3 [Candidatus Dojkabacteria bacterium]